MTLPAATPQNPACGACGVETRPASDGWFCEECLLNYDADLVASFTDADAVACGEPCGNWWHGDDRSKAGWRFACHPCQLPAGHSAAFHWTGCARLPDIQQG